MEAAVCESPGKIGFRSMPVPDVTEGNVLVKLEGCGVCGSNLPLWEGRPWFKYPLEPGAPGHEGWGRVERVGCNVRGVKEGDRVAFLSSHAFARYDLVPADSLIVLPPELDKVPFPGEPLGCAMNIINRCDIRKGQNVAVVGAGFIGTLLISLAAKRKATVLALSRRRSSLDIARNFGASAVIPLTEDQEVIDAGRECDRREIL